MKLMRWDEDILQRSWKKMKTNVFLLFFQCCGVFFFELKAILDLFSFPKWSDEICRLKVNYTSITYCYEQCDFFIWLSKLVLAKKVFVS